MYIFTRIQREIIGDSWEDEPITYYAIEYTKPNGNRGYKDTRNIEEATRYVNKPNKSKYNSKLDNYGGYKIEEIKEG